MLPLLWYYKRKSEIKDDKNIHWISLSPNLLSGISESLNLFLKLLILLLCWPLLLFAILKFTDQQAPVNLVRINANIRHSHYQILSVKNSLLQCYYWGTIYPDCQKDKTPWMKAVTCSEKYISLELPTQKFAHGWMLSGQRVAGEIDSLLSISHLPLLENES